MTILFKFDRDGGFICGDTETGRTAYAYPTSSWAIFAHRSRPSFVASRMMAHENTCNYLWRDADHFAAKDRERLAGLMP
jgi:hypothetical protein